MFSKEELFQSLNCIKHVWAEEDFQDESIGIKFRYHAKGTDNCAILSVYNGKIYIAFRGTENWQNVLSHLNISPMVNFTVGKVHRGWSMNYYSVADKILKEVDNYKDMEIVITGHSMGGAMAGICALELIHKKRNVRLLQLASPNFTDNKGFETIKNISVNYINGHDPIDYVVPWLKSGPKKYIGKKGFWPKVEDHYFGNVNGSIGYLENLYKEFGIL